MLVPVLASLLLLSSFASSAAAASADKPPKPCTAISPTTQRFFDLNPMHRAPPDPKDKDSKSKKKGVKAEDEGSWHARGYDYGANFTINFCGPVVEDLDDVKVVDIAKDERKNVSAFYERDGKTYAIGLESYTPVFRGRKLVLNYTGGSFCPSASSRSLHAPINLSREMIDGDDEDRPSKSSRRRKSTIISLLCESDAMAKTSISFVAAVDDCVYFFEGRSPHACGGVHVEKQALSPGGVFGVIMLIAILVYLVGGCVYQRTVMHQRGWRQLPNYSMWAGIAQFFADMFIILTSSCARFLPHRRGYSRVSLGHDSRGRNRRNDDEDRLIDNLDEEWDD